MDIYWRVQKNSIPGKMWIIYLQAFLLGPSKTTEGVAMLEKIILHYKYLFSPSPKKTWDQPLEVSLQFYLKCGTNDSRWFLSNPNGAQESLGKSRRK